VSSPCTSLTYTLKAVMAIRVISQTALQARAAWGDCSTCISIEVATFTHAQCMQTRRPALSHARTIKQTQGPVEHTHTHTHKNSTRAHTDRRAHAHTHTHAPIRSILARAPIPTDCTRDHHDPQQQHTHTHAPVRTTPVHAPTPTEHRALATQPNPQDVPTDAGCTRAHHDPQQSHTRTHL
jgi:hypothetical protein